jgi:hypothetical protein
MAKEKPYKAYDSDGNEHGYDTAVDLHQACALAGYSLTPPGEQEPAGADPMRNYAGMSAEDLRKLCASRRIPKYVSMTRDEKVDALVEYDQVVAAKLEAAPKKGGGK